MDNKLVNIALASVFFEQQRNFLETYFPFVLKSFQGNTVLDLKQIKSNIDALFNIDLPYNTIKGILDKNKTNTFQIQKIGKQDWRISLSDNGAKELAMIIENESTQSDRLETFYNDFINYSKEYHNTDFEYETVQNLINDFILNNLIDISIEDLKKKNGEKETETIDFEKLFVNYLLHIKRNSVLNTETFDNLWKGTIIWNELKKESLNDVTNDFPKRITLFIDSNIILSLLGFHNEVISESVKELFNLIKETNSFDLFVLDITLEEIYELLDTYLLIKDNFTDIEIDTVFYYLKKQGYNAVKIEKLKDNLAELLKKEYEIHKTEVFEWNKSELLRYSEIYNHLIQIREIRNEQLPERTKRQQEVLDKRAHHDASAINYAIHCKDRYASNWEKVKAAFLTGSYWLFVDYKRISNQFERIPAVILDSTLTNILYLKNPNSNIGISIDQVVKLHCNYLIVDKDIWIQFKQTIKELQEDNTISVEDHARLIAKNQITERYLLDVSDESLSRDDVLSILEKIKAEEKERELELKSKEEKINSLADEKSDLEQKVITSQKTEELLRSENRTLSSKKGDLEKQLNQEIEEKEKSSVENKRLKSILREKKFKELIDSYNDDFDLALQPKIKEHFLIHRKTVTKISFLVAGLIIISVITSLLIDHYTNSKSLNWLKHVGYLVPNLVTIIVCLVNWKAYKNSIYYFISKKKKTKMIDEIKERYAVEYEKLNPKPKIDDIVLDV